MFGFRVAWAWRRSGGLGGLTVWLKSSTILTFLHFSSFTRLPSIPLPSRPYKHAYIHTYIHTYVHTCISSLSSSLHHHYLITLTFSFCMHVVLTNFIFYTYFLSSCHLPYLPTFPASPSHTSQHPHIPRTSSPVDIITCILPIHPSTLPSHASHSHRLSFPIKPG